MRVLTLFLSLAVSFLPTALVQADPIKPVPTPPKLTLAKALAALPPPTDGGLRVTVSAELVTLPDTAAPPPADADVAEVAAAFGDQIMPFGTVVAVAPPTMTLLNTQPDPPNIAADLNPYLALKMLAASLDDAQWAALTSEHGLGLPDLADDTQRGLFHALLLHGRLWVGSEDPSLSNLPDEQRTDVSDVSAQIDAVRIRLGQTAKFRLHDTHDEPIFSTFARPDAAQRLHTWHPKTPPSPIEHGVALKADIPNTLKLSDLDYDRSELQAPISVAGLKTVGDLVTRIGQKTGLTLYADPHYAARTLTVQGAASAPASDLLRAVCVCVTGTFRKVGGVYVLTDDLVGVGVRRKHLNDWAYAADQATVLPRDQAGIVMTARHAAAARNLPAFGDPLAVTPGEMAALPDDPEMPGLPTKEGMPYAVSKLTPAQQAWLRQAAADYNDAQRSKAQEDEPREASASGKAELEVYFQVQLLVPSQSTPVDLFSGPLSDLYYPGEDALMAALQASNVVDAAKALAKLPPPPPLSAVLHAGRCWRTRARPKM